MPDPNSSPNFTVKDTDINLFQQNAEVSPI